VTCPQVSIEFQLQDPPAVAQGAQELRERGYRLLHDAKIEPWGQTVARLPSPEGVITRPVAPGHPGVNGARTGTRLAVCIQPSLHPKLTPAKRAGRHARGHQGRRTGRFHPYPPTTQERTMRRTQVSSPGPE
jgi:hypothetical protein